VVKQGHDLAPWSICIPLTISPTSSNADSLGQNYSLNYGVGSNYPSHKMHHNGFSPYLWKSRRSELSTRQVLTQCSVSYENTCNFQHRRAWSLPTYIHLKAFHIIQLTSGTGQVPRILVAAGVTSRWPHASMLHTSRC